MADAGQIIERIRSHGANVLLDGDRLEIVNRAKLPAGAADFIRQNAKAIAAHLGRESEFEERAAIIEYEGGLTRAVAEYLARLLQSNPPAEVSEADWSWFVGQAAKIVDASVPRRAAA